MKSNRNYLGKFFLIILGLSALIGGVIFICLLYHIKTAYTSEYIRQITSSSFTESPDKVAGHVDSTPNEDMKSFNIVPEKPEKPQLIREHQSTQEILETAANLKNDPVVLAEKYRGIKGATGRFFEPPIEVMKGGFRKFWVLNVDKNEYRRIDAELVYETPHVNFWIEEGANYIIADVKDLMDEFEDQIYQQNREIFGEECSPGIDNDVHLTILYAKNLGSVAGYFSSTDLLMPRIQRFSNMSEMFYLSADHLNLGDPFTYGVLAHEFQHMIHWNIDRNEASWINEGLSELAVDINGLKTGGFSLFFAANTDLQLNFWPGKDQGDSTPHYGASYLFMKYLFERFGNSFINTLVLQPENGMQGLEKALSSTHVKNQLLISTFKQIYQDWTIANILQDDEIALGIYGYGKEGIPFSFFPTEKVRCGPEQYSRSINQFGADYIEITCESDYKISIQWNKNIPVLTENPKSGKYYYWSNAGDESGMSLSREFDLKEVSEPVKLSYWTWFDIEDDYDYLYVNISEDGKKWQNLKTPSCSIEDPTGLNLGCGYNGKSDGWIREILDLSDYAGKKITVEFEYITDASVNGEGFLLDDIELEVIEFVDDFEIDDGKWEAKGFVRIENSLPQFFGVSIIDRDGEMEIEKFLFENQSEFSYVVKNNDTKINELVAVSGLSRFTHKPAQYKISILRID